MTDLTGQTAIVTGATGGVGRATAARLLARGATVVLVGRTEDAVEGTIATMGWRSAPVKGYAVDLAGATEVATFARLLRSDGVA